MRHTLTHTHIYIYNILAYIISHKHLLANFARTVPSSSISKILRSILLCRCEKSNGIRRNPPRNGQSAFGYLCRRGSTIPRQVILCLLNVHIHTCISICRISPWIPQFCIFLYQVCAIYSLRSQYNRESLVLFFFESEFILFQWWLHIQNPCVFFILFYLGRLHVLGIFFCRS